MPLWRGIFYSDMGPTDTQTSNQSSLAFSFQMMHSLKWTSNPVQMTPHLEL